MRTLWPPLLGLALALAPASADAACCYFSAQNADILQPAQKVFISWDPVKGLETFTVQPKFECNALDFGMVIPTPSQPKLHEMPRDFFKELAVFSILKKREQPQSKLLNLFLRDRFLEKAKNGAAPGGFGGRSGGAIRPPAVKVLEAGVVGNLDYKIIEAGRADDLFTWLKENKYSYSGDEGTLDFYIQKKWLFTVMKIDTMQMKRRPDGSFDCGYSRFLRMVKTASSLKKSRGISSSFGRLGVGMTMPKSLALPSNRGCTVNDSTSSAGSHVTNAFWAGCSTSASFAAK